MDEQPQETEASERMPYPEEQRLANLAKLRDLLGGPPPAEAMALAFEREREFAERRSHAA